MTNIRLASPRVDGDRLRILRQEAGLTSTELARRIGISQAYLSQIEVGARPTVSPATFNRIVAVMGVDRSDLLRSIEQVVA